MTRLGCVLVVCLGCGAPAFAQQDEPIGRFAFDARGVFARHKVEPSVATDLGVAAANLPPRSWGVVGGAHVYVWHMRKVTVGVGGELAWARGSRTLYPTPSDRTAAPAAGPTVRRHFLSLAPEVSLNFGHRRGWSYISGGMFGRSRLYLDRGDVPASNVPMRATINYGGGARWFKTDHIAFSVDFRWYSAAELPAGPGYVLQPRTTLLMLSGGVGIK